MAGAGQEEMNTERQTNLCIFLGTSHAESNRQLVCRGKQNQSLFSLIKGSLYFCCISQGNSFVVVFWDRILCV